MQQLRYLFLVVNSLLWFGSAQQGPADCSVVNWSPQQLREFATTINDRSDVACAQRVIEKLAKSPDKASIDVLSRLLDFKYDPEEEARNHKIMISHARLPINAYPAVSALYEIGKRAVPAVAAIVSEEGTTSIARNNGITLITMIFNIDQPGAVDTLVSEARRNEADPDRASRALDAARNVVERCMPELKAKCAGRLPK